MSSRRTTPALLVAALALTGAAAGLVPAQAAPTYQPDPYASVTYQQNPHHDGGSADPGFVAPLAKAWSKDLGGTVGYPVIADGRVFVAVAHSGEAYGDDVVAMSVTTGDVLWGPTSIGGAYHAGAIAYDRGRLFAINNDGLLTAFDAATGEVDWETRLDGQYSFTSAPTATGGTLYVGGAGTGGTLYAVDEATGVTRWTGDVANGDSSSPAVSGRGVYVSYACEQAYRFNLRGRLVWHHNTDCSGGGGRTPVLHEGRVYVRDDAGKVPAVLDAATGRALATYDTVTAPAFDGRRMATVGNGVLAVTDLRTGVRTWSRAASYPVTAPLVANHYVVVGTRDGTVEVRLVQDGRLVWSGQTGVEMTGPDEHNAGKLVGLAQGDGALAVPAGSTLTVFAPTGPSLDDTVSPTVTFASLDRVGAQVVGRWSATDDGSGVHVYQARLRKARLGHGLPAWQTRTPTVARAGSFVVRRDARLCVSVRAQDGLGNWSDWTPSRCVSRR